MSRHCRSRQFSAIRDLNGRHFDMLAGVIFDENYYVVKAALIPIENVIADSKFVAHTNSYRFVLRDSVWRLPNVLDVTAEITAAMSYKPDVKFPVLSE